MADMRPERGLLPTLIGMLALFVVVAIDGCHSGGDSDSDDRTTYNYRITSANFFKGGEQVAVIRFGLVGSCLNPRGVTSDITRVGAATVKTPGTVSFSFKTDITPPMFESVYIDNNASGNLDYGDRVWGDDPYDSYGACWDSFGVSQVFDWEVVASQIQAIMGLSQPSILYAGSPQPYRDDSSSEPGLTIDKAVIAAGDGYDVIAGTAIDIDPSSKLNIVDPGSEGLIAAAVLGSIDFDATQIDFSSVHLGTAGAGPVNDGHVVDINGDGFPDMVFHFEMHDTGIVCTDSVAVLAGKTFQGDRFTGSDDIMTLDCP